MSTWFGWIDLVGEWVEQTVRLGFVGSVWGPVIDAVRLGLAALLRVKFGWVGLVWFGLNNWFGWV